MAKLTLVIEDLPGGELKTDFQVDGAGTFETVDANTATQNMAIALALFLTEHGITTPIPSSDAESPTH